MPKKASQQFSQKSKPVCPVCSQKRLKKFWALKGYRLARCLSCGMVWDPYPPQHALEIYDNSYFINENPKGGYANYFEGMAVNKKTFTDRLKNIEKVLGKKGKILDVGCALGDCLLEAKHLGWDGLGLEASEYACEFARKRGLKVIQGTLDKTLIKEKFEVVSYQDVIEHISDPVAELKRVNKLLKPGGWVFLVTPDIEGFWSKLLGSMWYHYKPVEHVSYFSQKTIANALSRSGFKNLKTKKTYHVLSLEYILNRLKYYSPGIFEFLLMIIKRTPARKIGFRAYTGELEAWGQK